jgi:hypothetical protein
MALITMSKKELGRLETLVDLDEGRITAVQAAGLIGVGERQVFRLLKAYRMRGAEGLVSRRRGRPSNRRYRDEVREAALTRIRECYADFGPTLAAEKLAELHELRLGRETVRRWMAAAGPRPARPAAVPGFAAVTIASPAAFPVPVPASETASSGVPASSGLIEIELPDGGRVRIAGAPDPAVVAAALRALTGR